VSKNPKPQPEIDLQNIIAEDIPSEGDGAVEDELQDFAAYEPKARLVMDQEAAAQSLGERSQDMSARKNYARCIFFLLVAWLGLVFSVVIASGYKACPIYLSDAVLIALISGASVGVIGLFAIVANYLFPRK